MRYTLPALSGGVSSILPPLNLRRVFLCGIAFVLFVVIVMLSGEFFEQLDAEEIMVIQAPLSGDLTWYTSPGVKWQGFGKVTKYPKRFQYWFTAKADQGSTSDQSIQLRFNDGGHANLSGSIAVGYPVDAKNLTSIHTQYGSREAVEQQLVRPVIEKAVYMTGPLMSSAESYAERRNELISFIEDQVENGVYQTFTEEVKQADPITNEQKTVSVVKLKVDPAGNFLRQDQSPLKHFGFVTFNLSINNVKYDDRVESQIQQQQQAKMQVTTAMARAKQAEQDAITAQKNGEAEAAKAKWEQEVVKAKEVTAAQQRLAVAQLDAQAAEQTKLKLTLEGQGEAAKRQLIMNADGGLDKKIDAYVTTQTIWAGAFKEFRGQLVPSVVMTGTQGGTAPASGVTTFMEMMTAKAARDLAIDIQAGGAARTKNNP